MLTTYDAVANMYLNCIDVRDVADAHVKAMACEAVCVLYRACMYRSVAELQAAGQRVIVSCEGDWLPNWASRLYAMLLKKG